MKFYWFALAALWPLLSPAADLPEPVLPAGVGVNIHFITGHQRDLELVAAAGFKFIRMDFAWSNIERSKGEYDWSEYEQLLGNLEQRGLRAIFILDYSHPLYEETVTSPEPLSGVIHKTTASPQHPESIAAYARWAAAAAAHFHGRRILWELWNEPNGNFWAPKPDAQQYTTLALAAAKAIREADPQAVIIGPATSGFPWEFLETFLKSGVLEYLDAVSVHPYRNPKRSPETAVADYQKLRQLIDRYAPAARKDPLPILSGEWGYSSFPGGVSLQTQADYAARQQLVNLLNGIPLSIWYDWKNDGEDPKENEHNFGTVLPDLKRKPAYVAIQTLTRELSGYHIVRRLPLADEKDYALLCANAAGQQKVAAWTLGEPHAADLELGPKPPGQTAGVTGSGQSSAAKTRFLISLTAAPQYVALPQ
jgi:polysaccharide biosynthesis protein PslG